MLTTSPLSFQFTLAGALPAHLVSLVSTAQGAIMPAPQLPFPDQPPAPPPSLRLWSPGAQDPGAQDSPAEHRITNPVLLHPEPNLFEELAAEYPSGPARVPESELPRVRRQTVTEFYEEWMRPWRKEQAAARPRQIAEGTLSKERQVLRRFAAYELEHPPAKLPRGAAWKGWPIASLPGGYLDAFYESLRPPKYSKHTVTSTRNHLRTVLNFATQLGVLTKAPQAKPLDLEDADDVEEDLSKVWTDSELEGIYDALKPWPDMQAAFVLGCNAGPRSVDLFSIVWDKNVRLSESPPMLNYRAKKTGKKHHIPLAPVTVAHLERLQKAHLFDPGGLVFPKLTSGRCKDPERSKAARARTDRMKAAMREAGAYPYERPWQVCRATCCTRLDVHQPGVGSWVIGQGGGELSTTKLAAEFYSKPKKLVVESVMSLPQPANWS